MSTNGPSLTETEKLVRLGVTSNEDLPGLYTYDTVRFINATQNQDTIQLSPSDNQAIYFRFNANGNNGDHDIILPDVNRPVSYIISQDFGSDAPYRIYGFNRRFEGINGGSNFFRVTGTSGTVRLNYDAKQDTWWIVG